MRAALVPDFLSIELYWYRTQGCTSRMINSEKVWLEAMISVKIVSIKVHSPLNCDWLKAVQQHYILEVIFQKVTPLQYKLEWITEKGGVTPWVWNQNFLEFLEKSEIKHIS